MNPEFYVSNRFQTSWDRGDRRLRKCWDPQIHRIGTLPVSAGLLVTGENIIHEHERGVIERLSINSP